MAFWKRRKEGYVYVYTQRGGKQVALPRSMVKHLDGETIDSNIDAWVANYERQYENKKVTPDGMLLGSDDLGSVKK